MRFRPANIRLINRRSNLPRLLLVLSSENGKSNRNDKNNHTDVQGLTGHSISERNWRHGIWLRFVQGRRRLLPRWPEPSVGPGT
jgi:hypothetical protein